MIKIAFFDIDNTLVRLGEHGIAEDSRRALDELKDRGIKVFIASGRHKCIMDNLDGYPFDGYVCTNGSLVFAGGEVIYRHPVCREDSYAIAETARRYDIPCMAYHENGVCVSLRNETAYDVFRLLRIAPPPEVDLVGFVREHPVYEFTPFMGPEKEALFEPLLTRTVFVRLEKEFVDLNPDDISKAVGMESVLEHYGFTREESIAFGDGWNDVQMLRFAGIGVAMGNASDGVRKLADYVTTTVDEGGVPEALRHFGLIG
ncbi:MAG: Cof-type HAD-IIB family hydrolase [Clostridia bacterium]|nr:Cof-type HAD-IIB family hydrolase [Clostridia bacterium]